MLLRLCSNKILLEYVNRKRLINQLFKKTVKRANRENTNGNK